VPAFSEAFQNPPRFRTSEEASFNVCVRAGEENFSILKQFSFLRVEIRDLIIRAES
jgi:hypothetical protein